MKKSNFNDGYIRVYKEIPVRTEFGAKKNVKALNSLDLIVKLAYEECSKRLQDIEFAEANSRSLSLKVKTRLYPIKNDYKVVINNILYDIITMDSDRIKREMYLYLEKVRELNE